MFPSLQRANVSENEFKSCWFYLHPRLSDDELFSLFKDSGFSPRDHEVTGIAFVRAVLQRYKDAKVFSGFYQYVFLYAFALFTYCLRVRSSCLPAWFIRSLIRLTFKRKKLSPTHSHRCSSPRLSLVILETISRTSNRDLSSSGNTHTATLISQTR